MPRRRVPLVALLALALGATAAPARADVTVGWVGDTVPASSDIGLPARPWSLLRRVTPLLAQPDLTFANLEGTFTRRGREKCRPDGATCFVFRSPPAYARLLRGAGIDVVSLANNHALDFGAVGQRDTEAALDGQGIGYTGTPGTILVRSVRGVPVAFVAFAPYPWASPLLSIPRAQALVRAARARAPIVIVGIHAGAEGVGAQHVTGHEEWFLGEDRGNPRAFAHAMIAAGASAVVGSGPHVVRGLELYHGRPIAYSTGNFVGWRTFSLGAPRDVSALVVLRFDESGRFVRGLVRPTRLVAPGYAAPDPARRAVALIRKLSRADFGVSALRPDGRFAP